MALIKNTTEVPRVVARYPFALAEHPLSAHPHPARGQRSPMVRPEELEALALPPPRRQGPHRDHRRTTRTAVAMAGATVLFLACLAAAPVAFPFLADGGGGGVGATGGVRSLEDEGAGDDDGGGGSWTDYSCSAIFSATDPGTADRCDYASECGGGEGIFASFVFCRNSYLSTGQWVAALSPLLLVWLVALFRMLGSTAEDFFSPSLEMFSLKMGLPPRFAGVSLLALGNGSADVSATMNAIVADPAGGYRLSLGALTGAAMFIGCVVAGSIMISGGGVVCRGALVRDVVMMMLTVLVVWHTLRDGSIGPADTSAFFGMYSTFVLVVLAADVYHRAVVVPRLRAAEEARESLRQLNEEQRAIEAAATAVDRVAAEAADGTPAAAPLTLSGGDSAEGPRVTVPNRALDAVLTALSNYDKYEERGTYDPQHAAEGWGAGVGVDGTSSERERLPKLHGRDGLLSRHSEGPAAAMTDGEHHLQMAAMAGGTDGGDPAPTYADSPYRIMEGVGGVGSDDGTSESFGAHSWTGAWYDGREELRVHWREVYDDIFTNEDNGILDKFLLAVELPFTLLRKLTVPIPCDGSYCRALVALSLVISPLWLGIYLLANFEINLFWKDGFSYILILEVIVLIAGAITLRFAPGGDGPMNLAFAGPIALYGFVVAATWIDAVANKLVSLLNFLGIVCHIPSAVMGLTILAWGNSMADLSANVTMARKGLANMAMTACFAGPVFNLLIGLGLGFTTLRGITGSDEIEVTTDPSITTGFIFTLINCIALIVTGVFLGGGFIPERFGYLSLAIYGLYVIVSLYLQFR